MSAFDIVLVIYGVILSLTALSVVYRMVVGPTILDRAISTDSLVVLVVLAMALYVASSKAAWAGPAMLGLTGLAFIATVTFARFVAREEPLQGRRHTEHEEPGSATGPLDAIHADHDGTDQGLAAPEPVNAFDTEQGDALGAAGADSFETEDAGSFGAEDDDSFGAGDADSFGAGADDSERGFGAEDGTRGFEDDSELGFGTTDGTGEGR